MNEQNNRKTLISIRVSTLLLIILTIIVLIIVGVSIANKVKEREVLETQAQATVNDIQETTENLEETQENEVADSNDEGNGTISVKPERKAVITSRSSAGREQIPVVEEETTEQVVEETVPTEPATTPIEEVTISKDMDLTVRTGLSRDDFILLISGVKEDTSNFFEENAGLIFDVCEKYQINEIFFCGLISAESGWNIAQNHRNTHNYISLMSYNGLIKYASVEEGIEEAAKVLHNNYLTPGGKFYYGKTLSAVKTKFCPASSTWVNLVYQRMSQILN